MTASSGQPLRAAFWMIGTIVSFSAMAVAGREASAELDTFEIMTYRSIAGLVIVVTFAAASGALHELRGGAMRLHFIRNITHFAATNLWFFAVATIPLAQVFAFEFSTPLWTAAMAPFLLGEKLTRGRAAATAVGFAGIVIIVRPGFIEFSPGVAAAVLCAVGFAAAAIATRKLVQVQRVTAVLFWMAALQTVFSIVCAGADGDIRLPSQSTFFPIALIAVCGLTAHLCLTNALKIAPATVVMPLDFARLPAIAVVGLLVYGEAVNIYMAAGAAIILCANYANIKMATKAVY